MSKLEALPQRRAIANRVLFALKLLFIVAALGFFLYGIATTYAFVVFLQEDTSTDFLDGTFFFTGLSAKDDMVTLLPIGLTGDWSTDGSALPVSLTDLAAVAMGNRIFVVGGYSDEGGGYYRTEIYSATVMNITGTLSAWTTIGHMPAGLGGHQVVLHPTTDQTSTLLILGGVSEDSAPDSSTTTYRAVVDNATGGLVGPVVDGPPLEQPVHYHSSVLWGDYAYVIGGNRLEPFHDATYDLAYYAPVSEYGVLGNFAEMTATLPYPVRSAAGVLYTSETSQTIFLMGGTESTESSSAYTPTVGVLIGDIDPDTGIVESWRQSGSGDLVVPVWGHAGVIANGGNLFVLGGRAGNLSNPVISSTVKSALVTDDDVSRIYNWCGREPCERWQGQQGDQLLAARSGSAAVVAGGYIYVMGGVDEEYETSQSTVFRGGVGGVGDKQAHYYAPSGYYRSDAIDLDSPNPQNRNQVKGLSWRVDLSGTTDLSLTMEYRYWRHGDAPPDAWTTASASQVYDEGDGGVVFTSTIDSPVLDTRYFQYQANMTTYSNVLTPRFDWVQIYFDVPDPDVQVSKSGPVGVYPNETFSFTINYTAAGGVPAAAVALTDAVPSHASYLGPSGWHLVGGDVYTYDLGTIGSLGSSTRSGSVGYEVKVDESIPEDVDAITNVVSIGYPPMIDDWGNSVVDPIQSNNVYTYVVPLYRVSWDIEKSAEPPSTVVVMADRPLITYTINYTYSGVMTETGPVWITDIVDIDYLEIVTYSSPSLVLRDGNTLVWEDEASQIGSGQGRSISFTVQVTRPLENGTQFSNQASIGSQHSIVEVSQPVVHTVVSTSTLELVKDAVPAPDSYVLMGSDITYVLTATNSGGMNAAQAVITDTFDADYLSVMSYSPGGVLAGSDTITWSTSLLPVDTAWTVTFTARVSNVSDVTIDNHAVIASEGRSPVTSNEVRHFVPTVPVLAVEKDDGRVEVQPGEVLTYQISFENVGGGVARSVRITETFPVSVMDPLATEPDWSSCGSGCYYYEYPDDLGAETQWITFTGRVRTNAPLGHFTNEVSISSAEVYVASAGDSDEDIVVLYSNATIEKSDGLSTVDPGDYLTYTIECANPDSTGYDLVLTDVLPSGVRYVGYGWQNVSDSTYTRTLRLNPKQTVTLLLFAQVEPGAIGSLANTVTMDGGEFVSFLGGNQAVDGTDINSGRDLVIYKTDTVGGVRPGQRITYTISYTNLGNLAVEGVYITDSLPVDVEYVTAGSSCGSGWTHVEASLYHASIGSLGGGESGECTLVATVDGEAASGFMSNEIRISGSQADDDWTNSVFTDTDLIYDDAFSDLYVVTVGSVPITPTVGASTNFTVSVSNLGPGTTVHILPSLDDLTGEQVVATFRLPKPSEIDPTRSIDLDYCNAISNVVYIGLYVDPYREPERPDSGWWDRVGYFNLPLAEGQRAVVDQWWHPGDSDFVPANYRFGIGGEHQVYAQVDVWDLDSDQCGWGRTYGHIPETDETNNVTSAGVWVESGVQGDSNVYLPIIAKNFD